MSTRPTKEPIRKVWPWVVLALVILAAIPWYLPTGSLRPLVWGIPYWILISLFFSLVFCGCISYLCLKEWDIVEEEEQQERADAMSETENGSERG